mmetsp:Transcript_2880/g.10954  ORF Transcript_2880/g.10954 Transcript_2880/m.10954 type:complete len:277 (-) Transcript_2880:417-1247(-)
MYDDTGGGGFVSQPAATQGGGSDDKKKGRGQQALVPVTIKMARTATFESEDRWSIGGREMSMVRIVGNIQRAETNATRITLHVEDGTGSLEATIWTSQNDEDLPTVAERRSKCVAGAYVVFHGSLREFNGKTTLRVVDARPVEDFNEITTHFLEVIYADALYQQRLRDPPADATTPFGGGGGGAAPSASAGPMDVDNADPTAVGSDGMTGIQRGVLKFYTEYGTGDEGLHISKAIEGLVGQGKFSESQIRDAIDSLLADGFLYTTLDEDHCKSTEG